MKLSMVVAVDEAGGIGFENRLPWSLPRDLQHFKQLTLGKPVIMGRRTFESIGRPLPNRTNIVLCRSEGFSPAGCQVAPSLDAALGQVAQADEVVIIGGAGLFQEAIDRVDRIHLTRVHARLPADTFFPKLDPADWQELDVEVHPADERHAHPFTFVTLQRIRIPTRS